jgi:hypothetical protein
MTRSADDMFRTLKPAGMDGRVAEAHARRREHDLAGALDETRSVRAVQVMPVRRRMPRVLIAGLAVGAVAVAAGVVVATDGSGGAGPAEPGTGRTLDARTILLAGAETVAKDPARTGAYWYTRERETRLVAPMTFSAAQKKAMAAKMGDGGKVNGKAEFSSPVTAYVSGTEESWNGRDRHNRTITGIDRKISFPSSAEEAKWKKLGAAERRRWDLDVPGRSRVSDYDFSKIKLSVTQRDKTVGALAKLPTDPAALEKTMRTWFKHENQLDGGFAMYVFGEAQDLLAGPTTPGAKAALYRLLAKQQGIHYLGTANDALGRRGAVLAMGDPTVDEQRNPEAAGEIRLIIDTRTGRLLAQESGNRKAPSLTMTYEATGWADHLGDRP